MGTRADFYVGRGKDAEWLGSIAWDGYPGGITPQKDEWPTGAHLFDATTDIEYRERLERFFHGRDDVSRPADGWPWPWEDSHTTDYAYAFDAGRVWATGYDGGWFLASEPEPDEEAEDELPQKPRRERAVFPNMKARQRVTFGKRSGVMVISPKGIEDLP